MSNLDGPEVLDCVVLGAGIAGVTPARDLARQGYRVLVLEGSDRIGGRMHSRRDFVQRADLRERTAAFPLELGAEYVHVGNEGRYGRFLNELEWLDGALCSVVPHAGHFAPWISSRMNAIRWACL